MHLQTHILSGWCIANLFPLTPRHRLFAMLSASLCDLDGVSILMGQKSYQEYHHLLTHNLPTAVLFSGAFAFFSTRWVLSFGLYLALFHLHLVMDYLGSGPLWPIAYFWPFSRWHIVNAVGWEFYSWQNLSTFFAFLVWTIAIAYRLGRTPLELIMPSLDKQLIARLRPLTSA